MFGLNEIRKSQSNQNTIFEVTINQTQTPESRVDVAREEKAFEPHTTLIASDGCI